MTTFFFSSTGNSLSVAKKIGGELISIPQAMKEEQIRCQDDAVGLVFPVYGLSVPPLILRFLDRAEFQAPYVFAVLTYGTYPAAAARHLTEYAGRKGLQFDYVNVLHMQENYLPGFAMENQKRPVSQGRKQDAILADIHRQTHFIKHDSGFAKCMTQTHQKHYKYEIGRGFTGSFTVSASCVGCGLCEKICPMDNIGTETGKPVFKDHCCSCFACIQNCPQGALSIKGEKGRGRYRNPEIALAELIEANGQHSRAASCDTIYYTKPIAL